MRSRIGAVSEPSKGANAPPGEEPSGLRGVFRASPQSSAFTDVTQLSAVVQLAAQIPVRTTLLHEPTHALAPRATKRTVEH